MRKLTVAAAAAALTLLTACSTGPLPDAEGVELIRAEYGAVFQDQDDAEVRAAADLVCQWLTEDAEDATKTGAAGVRRATGLTERRTLELFRDLTRWRCPEHTEAVEAVLVLDE